MSVEVVTKEMTERFQREVRRCSYPAKRLSREIGAHENTIGNYLRDHVPYQWVYLQQMHKKGLDIHYILLGADPDHQGLTLEETVMLKAYRQLPEHAQRSLMSLIEGYATDLQQLQN